MNIPLTLSIGDSAYWLDDAAEDSHGNALDPTNGWVLKYALRGPTSLDLTATVVDGQWKTILSKTASAGLSVGAYSWQAYVEKGSERITLATGTLDAFADLTATTGAYDGRTSAKKNLDAIQAAILARATGGGVAEYTIGNRSVRYMNGKELAELETFYQGKVNAEIKAAEQKANGGRVNAAFVKFTK